MSKGVICAITNNQIWIISNELNKTSSVVFFLIGDANLRSIINLIKMSASYIGKEKILFI